MKEFEVVLSRRPPKNPQPFIVSCGDCGACVLAGVLGIEVAEAYDRHESEFYHRGPLDPEPAKEIPKRSAFSYHSMKRTLRSLYYAGEIDRVIEDQPVWLMDQGIEVNGSFGVSSLLMQGALRRYWLALFDAGYYGLAQVSMHGQGPFSRGGVDHWVMLCGMRERREESTILLEVLIGDSALCHPQERWIGINEFLSKHGGFMALFARPAR